MDTKEKKLQSELLAALVNVALICESDIENVDGQEILRIVNAAIAMPVETPSALDIMRAEETCNNVQSELVQALKDLQKEIRAVVKFDVKKHYSLMVADASASKAVYKVESR